MPFPIFTSVNYTRKNWSGWCNVDRWTTPEQCCYQGSTTLVEFPVLMSIVWSIVVRCWQRTIIATMLLEQEPTMVDEKSLLMLVNNDWTMVVEREQLWTMVVDNIDQVVHFCACRMDTVDLRKTSLNIVVKILVSLRIWADFNQLKMRVDIPYFIAK